MTQQGSRLAGKVAIVTGAGRNIGRAEALSLMREGAKIVVNDVGGAEDVVKEIRDAGGDAVADNHSASSWAGGEASSCGMWRVASRRREAKRFR